MTKLTTLQLKNLTPADAGKKLRDGDGIIGKVRVKKDGSISISFTWRYRYNGHIKEVALGTYPALSMPKIRAKRHTLYHTLTVDNIDPATVNKNIRATNEAELAEQARDAARRKREAEEAKTQEEASYAELKARLTVQELFERWQKQKLQRRKDKGAEALRLFKSDVFPTLGNVAVADVTKAQISAPLDTVAARGAGVMARTLLGELRQMWSFAIKRGLAEKDPTSHFKRDDFGKKTERDRVLSDDEIIILHRQLPKAGMSPTSQLCIWLILATGCRVCETLFAEWSHVDFENKTWFLPGDNTKNKKPHTVYLSNFALKQLKLLHELTGYTNWLFPSSNCNDQPVNTKSLTKQVYDRQLPEDAKPLKNRTTKHTRTLVLPGGKWTPHDLRRTAATNTAAKGVSKEIVDKMLNHVEEKALVRIYQHAPFHKEQAEGWRLLGEHLESLIHKEENKVVSIY